jgi:Lon protease-like protein
MSTQPFDLPAGFDGQARLFPLSDLVMLPHNLMPLHVFESRYKEMLEDAVQGDQLIAMATLMPGFEHEYYCRGPIAPVVCIGRITEYEKTEAGTYNLMLLGLQRAEVESEIEPVRSFRRARIKLLDHPPVKTGVAEQTSGLQLAARLRTSFPATGKLVEQFNQGELSLATLTDIIAFHLPLPTNFKLELLAQVDPLLRTERLLERLPGANMPTQVKKRFPIEFSEN